MTSDWYQQQLTPSDVYELNIRLGIIPSTDHLQTQVELKDPMTQVQIAMWSAPHARWDSWPHMLDVAVEKARQQLGVALDPF